MSGGGMEAAGADRSPAAASVRWCLPVVGLAIVLVLSAIAAQAGPGSQSGQLGSARAAPGWQALPASFGPQLWREAREGASSTAILADEERRVTEAYAQLPLAFIPNAGQTDPSVRYYAQGAGYTFYFADHKAVLALQKGDRGQALDLRFLGANPNTKLTATGRHTGTVNYFTGAERHTNLPTYERLTYRDLWPGIDMLVGGNSGKLKYEFVVRPGAKISDIRLAYTGAERVSLSRSGGLLIHTPLGTLRDARPRTFQRVDGRRVAVETRYTLAGGSYGFTVGEHDRGRPLLIDPSLAYSTYLGGSAYDVGFGIALDSAGAAYVAGETQSTDFPTTAGAFDTSSNGSEAFVTKLNPAGTGLAYSTYLGGSGSDAGRGIAVDSAGAAYVTGKTSSTDFPTTAGAFDASLDGLFDAFVTKLDPAGSGLAYSTYLGGSDGEAFGEEGAGIAVDSSGAVYVAGGTGSRDFPTTAGAFDTTFTGGSEDAFVTKLNPAGSSLTYSTYLGGTPDDGGGSIAIDSAGAAYVTGLTIPPSVADFSDFPTTPGAFDTTYNGLGDAFVTKLNRAGSGLAFSTFLGGSDFDVGIGVAIDSRGAAYVTGDTGSVDFPTTAGAFDTSANDGGFSNAFVSKLDPFGSGLAYSTYLGGSSHDIGVSVAVDSAGAAYVTGHTQSTDFPITSGTFDTSLNGTSDAFVTKLDPLGSMLADSTYLGGSTFLFLESGSGIALDSAGAAYITGFTDATDFPTTAGAFDTSFSGGEERDAFITKLSFGPPPSTPQCKVTNDGQITADNGDTASFGGNAHSDAAANVKGQEQYRDHGPAQPLGVKSIRILAVICNQERTNATILGEATIDASGTHAFSIDVQDLGEPGKGTDTYRILLDTGYDSGVHTLQGGNVQIHNG
jgi:Beta-propeller repeat